MRVLFCYNFLLDRNVFELNRLSPTSIYQEGNCRPSHFLLCFAFVFVLELGEIFFNLILGGVENLGVVLSIISKQCAHVPQEGFDVALILFLGLRALLFEQCAPAPGMITGMFSS